MYEIILIVISLSLYIGYKYEMKYGKSGTESDLLNVIIFWIVSVVVFILDIVAFIAWIWNHFTYV